jgi:hypothetical protein
MGDGSYLYSFGIQKFTPRFADSIALYISNSPFVSWLSIFGIRGEAYLLGTIELTTGAFLAAGAFIPILSALGYNLRSPIGASRLSSRADQNKQQTNNK